MMVVSISGTFGTQTFDHFFQLFKELFDPVLNEQHRGFSPKDKHPAPELDASKVDIIL